MSDYFDRVERQILRNVQAGRPRSSRFTAAVGPLSAVAAVLVVAAVAAAFLGARARSPSGAPAGARAVRVVFTTSALDVASAAHQSLGQAVGILRRRLRSEFDGARVSRAGDELVAVVPGGEGANRARIAALAVPGRLAMYDWETSALTPEGGTVASRLEVQSPSALRISQGAGQASPGTPGAGGVSLYDAVKLASRQLPLGSAVFTSGPEYYLFGAPGSAACHAVARDRGVSEAPGIHCPLSGPASSPQSLMARLPRGADSSPGRVLFVVPEGTMVLQAADSSPGHHTRVDDPAAQFYVLRGNPRITGADIVNPEAGVAPSGGPAVTFDLTARGRTAFQRLSALVAARGNRVSRLGQTLDQHFAVTVDDKLLTVAAIDFKVYPDGIPGDGGVSLDGSFTRQSAEDLAAVLRFGPLPVGLRLR